MKYLDPVAISVLLITLVLLFALKGKLVVNNSLHVMLIAVQMFIQTDFIFLVGDVAAQKLKLSYEDAAPVAMIGAALATVVRC